MKLAALDRQVFERAGLQLSWFDAGGPGQPVVFQHGLCGDAGQTAEVFPDGGGFRLITLECRGHGRSQASSQTEFSITAFAEDVAALIDRLGLAPTVIGGISMGAAMALRLAVKRPELVRALILGRPAWITDAAPPNMAPNGEVGRLIATLPQAEAKAAFLAGATARRLSVEAPDNLSSLTGFFDRSPREVTAALLTAIAADGPSVGEGDLGKLAVPTLIIGTGNDAIHPLSHAQKLAALIPGAELAVITPKAIDRAAYVGDFQRVLQRFLEDI